MLDSEINDLVEIDELGMLSLLDFETGRSEAMIYVQANNSAVWSDHLEPLIILTIPVQPEIPIIVTISPMFEQDPVDQAFLVSS